MPVTTIIPLVLLVALRHQLRLDDPRMNCSVGHTCVLPQQSINASSMRYTNFSSHVIGRPTFLSIIHIRTPVSHSAYLLHCHCNKPPPSTSTTTTDVHFLGAHFTRQLDCPFPIDNIAFIFIAHIDRDHMIQFRKLKANTCNIPQHWHQLARRSRPTRL